MQIDFHQTASKAPALRRRETTFTVPLIWKRLAGGLVACIGLLLIFFSLTSLLLTRASTPYALIFFQKESTDKPQTHVNILWINEAKNTIQVTAVPDALEFHSQTLGTYPIESIYAAHQTTRQSDNDFLTDLSFYLRFPIRAYSQSDTPLHPSRIDLAKFILSSCTRHQSSLQFGECVHALLFFTSFSTSVRELKFPQSALGSGSVESIKPLDRIKYREWSQSHFSEGFSEWKKYTVAVLNGTTASGLATSASNIISDFGLSILSITETRTPQASGEIVLNSHAGNQKALVELLQSTLRLPSRIDDSLTDQYRSDVVVIIGASEVKFFTP